MTTRVAGSTASSWWGLDLGGSKLATVVLAPSGEGRSPRLLAQREWPVAGLSLASLIAEALGELLEQHGRPCCIGLAVAAAVGADGSVGASPNLAAPAGPALADWVAAAAGGCRPRVVNDGNAFLHGELHALAERAPPCAVAVVLGTGVGGAVAWAGQVRVGPAGLSGEWGHQPPPRETDPTALDRACGCGRRGCIDALLGGPGWWWTALRHGLGADSPEAAVAALRRGEPAALAAAAEYRERLARALSLWTDLLDPDLILLGGGLADVPELVGRLEGPVRAARYGQSPSPPIVVGALGRVGAAIGAALLAAERAC